MKSVCTRVRRHKIDNTHCQKLAIKTNDCRSTMKLQKDIYALLVICTRTEIRAENCFKFGFYLNCALFGREHE